jgi:hypothetical protein
MLHGSCKKDTWEGSVVSASEKLKALAETASDESPATDMLVVWLVHPQIVAVVEAAETHYAEWAAVNRPAALPIPLRTIGEALAALEEALS